MARGGRSGRARGEVAEICKALDHLTSMNGAKPEVIQMKRDCFQKLLRYMTQGIDMSAAFVPVTKCVALSKSDLPLKKMQYLYLRTTARQNSSVALLVVQTLLNDCKDLDPTIRGAALRSMASLRVPELMDTVFMAVEAGLRDPHHYVREAAVMGVLKCWHADAAGCRLRGLLGEVERALTADGDAQVVANCLYVMQQVGALKVTRDLVVSLLNHIHSFSDWAQCFVLDIVGDYSPASEEERFDILEVLDFGLSHTNSAVVMATVKLFLNHTAAFPDQQSQVLGRVRDALLTLVSGREHEVVYAALSNTLVLAKRHPDAFAPLFTDFYCRYQDPSYLKALKIDMLVAVTDASNAYDIAEELSQYIRDVDEQLARQAIRAVAAIALKVPEVNGILDRLLLFLGYEKDYVTAETLVQMAVVLRRYPDAAEACVDSIVEVNPETLAGPDERAAYIWVLGEHGQRVQSAPYLLEALVEGFADEAAKVRLALLAAVPRLFFRRAPECRGALGALLAAGAADADVEVRDRALFALRLLRHDVHAAREVLGAPLPLISRPGEEQAAEVEDRIFDEMNTLSVLYRAPAYTFIDPTITSVGAYDTDGEGSEEGVAGQGAPTDPTGMLLDVDTRSEASAGTAAPSPTPGSSVPDLLSLSSGPAAGAGRGAPDLHVGIGFPPAPALAGAGLDLLGDLEAVAGSSPAPAQNLGASLGGSGAGAGQPMDGGIADLLGGLGFGDPTPARPVTAEVGVEGNEKTGLLVACSGIWADATLADHGAPANPTHAHAAPPQTFAARWAELAHSARSAQVDLPLGVLPALATGAGVLARVALAAPTTSVRVVLEVAGPPGSNLQDALEGLQNLLLCL
ncbi:Beta-adaptin-like protein A [Auxenochlorella protothecoides]|uniref:Beta-adaptin-like protein A n=1 Tax=Auxenochlorella protothecoides TaxID=3075 RepID=A0A087SLF2_AUXPR|nr:Beta-adaptin-like protein A [Auxenochlorella protothecoides]KFM26556.1 Beta-adaptin-like protein A [Auxenochlorella protothecoides]